MITGVVEQMLEVKKIIELKKSADFSKCVSVAREYFEELFSHNIRNLVNLFPSDSVDEHG